MNYEGSSLQEVKDRIAKEMMGHIHWLRDALVDRGLDREESIIVMGLLVGLFVKDEERIKFIDLVKSHWASVDRRDRGREGGARH